MIKLIIMVESAEHPSLNFEQQLRLARKDNIQRIRERNPADLKANFDRTLRILYDFYEGREGTVSSVKRLLRSTPKDELEKKARRFLKYFGRTLFSTIIHKTNKELPEKTVLKSPGCLAREQAKKVEEVAYQAGHLDILIGNTDYVCACSAHLPSPFEGPRAYLITSENGYAVPLDIAHIPCVYPGFDIENYQDDLLVHHYAKNLLTIEDFKTVFATYCAVFFKRPQDAIGFLRRQYFFIPKEGFWLDESYMGSMVNTNKEEDARIIREMRSLWRDKNVLPPFSPEFQYKDKVGARSWNPK